MPDNSFYWFDYETFGTHPAWDRPCQFAGIRTDEQLNVIDEPLVIYCKQAMDYLPHPQACKVTGISPQKANAEGVIEAEFIRTVINQLGRPGTCSAGYNSIRFDDEFTRHILFRNFHDPYEYEWKDGNSRWDLLDVVRLTRALRPEGLNWPVRDDGTATNRLEDLSKANGIEHANAHDALADVQATIAMAKLIRQAQPRLFSYLFANRGKQSAAAMLNVQNRQPCVQVSGMIPAKRHHLGIILPLARHPTRPNSVIVLDLFNDPEEIRTLTASQIEQRLFQTTPTGNASRPGLRTVQINKCPVLVPMNTLREQDAERLQIDLPGIHKHLALAQSLYEPEISQRIIQAMSSNTPGPALDVDGSLYTGGFPDSEDRQRRDAIRSAAPGEIGTIAAHFNDERFRKLAYRFQARNYPESLTEEQSAHWRDHCRRRLETEDAPWLGFSEFENDLREVVWSDEEQDLRDELVDYEQWLRGYASAVDRVEYTG